MAKLIKLSDGILDEDTGLVWNAAELFYTVTDGYQNNIDSVLRSVNSKYIIPWKLPELEQLHELAEEVVRRPYLSKLLSIKINNFYWTNNINEFGRVRSAVKFNDNLRDDELIDDLTFSVQCKIILCKDVNAKIPKRIASQLDIKLKIKEEFF